MLIPNQQNETHPLKTKRKNYEKNCEALKTLNGHRIISFQSIEEEKSFRDNLFL